MTESELEPELRAVVETTVTALAQRAALDEAASTPTRSPPASRRRA